MIEFNLNEESVSIKIRTRVGYSIIAENKRGSKLDAVLLRNELDSALRAKIAKIRKDAYNQGWKDKASKNTAKKTEFFETIDSTGVGY